MAVARASAPYGPTTAWPGALARRDAVVIDLETTGMSPQHDRVTEIAAVRVHDGQIVDRWHTLVNPQRPIPPFVTALTGISTGMTATAPVFRDVAEELRSFVGTSVLVAHQASFDLGFLRDEFARLGAAPFAPESLCTVKLSRRLFPGLPSHSLEALIQAFGLPIRRHHRALPDALTAVDLLNVLLRRAGEDGIGDWDAVRKLANGPKRRRPLGLYERERIKDLPTGPGVYLLKDSDANIFYIGKSVNVRRRVQDHVRGGGEGQPMLRRQLKRLADVQVISTESELEALLLESQLIKRYLPVANQQLRDETRYPFIRIDVQSEYPRLELTRTPAADRALYFGPFRSARLVGAVVDYLRGALGIRECHRPSLPDGQPCLLWHLHRCLGPCIGAVTPEAYRAAVERAITLLRGEWTEIVEGLEARMRELAEREQFEEAATLRDLLARLRAVASAQHRLQDLGQLNTVLVVRLDGRRVRLLCVCAGRLVDQDTFAWPRERRAAMALCQRAFRQPPAPPTSQESVDQAWILSSWIQQHRGDHDFAVIDIDPTEVAPGLTRLRVHLDDLCGVAAEPTHA